MVSTSTSSSLRETLACVAPAFSSPSLASAPTDVEAVALASAMCASTASITFPRAEPTCPSTQRFFDFSGEASIASTFVQEMSKFPLARDGMALSGNRLAKERVCV